MTGMEAFFTRDKANEGRKLLLYTPCGTKTDEWLIVRHVWSDDFQRAEEAAQREARETVMGMGADATKEVIAEIQRGSRVRLLASLVAGWSFDSECTPDAAADFLDKAPQIADQIDAFAADAKGFFGVESGCSKSGSTRKKP